MALIILAHPNFDQSFANKTIIEELQKSNLELEIRNLYNLYPDFNIDMKVEQEALLRHQTIVFQYPFYWLNITPMLKQWFDLVFEYQFAYGSKGDKLKGKDFLPSFTVGSPEEAYRPLGKHHFRIYEFCKNMEQLAYYSQMNYIDPIYFHGTSLNVGYTVDDVRNRAKDHANRLIVKLEELQTIQKY